MQDSEILIVVTMVLAFLVVGLLAIYAHFKEKHEKSNKKYISAKSGEDNGELFKNSKVR